MREIRTSGSMSGDGKRDDVRVATAPSLDSTENKGQVWKNVTPVVAPAKAVVHRHPREGGGPPRLDSRLRGNDR